MFLLTHHSMTLTFKDKSGDKYKDSISSKLMHGPKSKVEQNSLIKKGEKFRFRLIILCFLINPMVVIPSSYFFFNFSKKIASSNKFPFCNIYSDIWTYDRSCINRSNPASPDRSKEKNVNFKRVLPSDNVLHLLVRNDFSLYSVCTDNASLF